MNDTLNSNNTSIAVSGEEDSILQNQNQSARKTDFIIVKVVFPILECSKLMKLNAQKVCYNPLIKILNKAKANIAPDILKSYTLFTEQGVPIYCGDSLALHQVKEKDILVFKNKDNKKDGESWAHIYTMLNGLLKRKLAVEESVPKGIFSYSNINSSLSEYEPLPLNIIVIDKCLQYLDNKQAYMIEGLFRLSGSKKDVKLVYESFKTDSDIAWVLDPHTIATALKHYIRFLSPPLLANEISTAIVHVLVGNADASTTTEILAILRQVPHYHKQALTLLVSFFKKMLSHQQENKMGLHNIAIVWGPNLMPIDLPYVDVFTHPIIQSTFASLFITHFDQLLW